MSLHVRFSALAILRKDFSTINFLKRYFDLI